MTKSCSTRSPSSLRDTARASRWRRPIRRRRTGRSSRRGASGPRTGTRCPGPRPLAPLQTPRLCSRDTDALRSPRPSPGRPRAQRDVHPLHLDARVRNLDSSRMPGQILAMGGGGFLLEGDSPLDDFLLSLSPTPRPRVCYLPTPAGDSDRGIATFFEVFSRKDCRPTCVRLFGAPELPTERLAEQDVIYVSGGNTANALALWRVHGIDVALREAWERGAVMGGSSAGANCWFECCVTDSFGTQLSRLD